jgi:hypothetical protein
MDQEAIINYIAQTFSGLEIQRPDDGPGAGDTFIFFWVRAQFRAMEVNAALRRMIRIVVYRY